MLFFLAEKFLLGGGILPETVFGVEFGWVEFLLATPVQVVLGWPFYKNSYNALVNNRRANMDVLIALGSSTAYFYSVAVLAGLIAGSLYFDTAALISCSSRSATISKPARKGRQVTPFGNSSKWRPRRPPSSTRTVSKWKCHWRMSPWATA